MNAPVSRMHRKRSQRGFALAELMIAIAVSVLIVFGTMTILRHLVIVSAENRDETMATLQVQYVGFWISEDVVQAQRVYLCQPDSTGFPLTVEWTGWEGEENRVVYRVEGMVDEKGQDLDLWALYRKHVVNPGEIDEIDYGESLVGQYLDDGLTKAFWREDLEDVLVLEVTARVDLSEANSTYEIYPRALRETGEKCDPWE